MLSISFAKEADTAEKHELKTENVMLSVEQPDVLRAGLNSAVLDTLPLKPAAFQDRRKDMLRQVAAQYGVGAAVRRQADLKVVEQFHRLPGLPSSFLGVEVELGDDSEIKFEDWLGDVHDNPRFQTDIHVTMQKHLGME